MPTYIANQETPTMSITLIALIVLVTTGIYTDIDSFRKAVEDIEPPDRATSLSFKYNFGFWPEIGTLVSEPLLDSQLSSISARLGLTDLNICDTAKSFVCGKLNSEFLGSEYWLVWIRSSLSMLGGFPPTTFFVVDSAGTGVLIPLTSKLARFQSDYLDILAEATEKVMRDAKVANVDISNCKQAAIDLITVCCPEKPIVFVDSAYDIYAFSNAVYDSTFWEIASSNDSLIALLTSYRLEHVGENSFFTDSASFSDVIHGWEEFADIDTVIQPIHFIKDKDGGIRVIASTWSLCRLTKWTVTFKAGSRVRIEYEIISDCIGFGFSYS